MTHTLSELQAMTDEELTEVCATVVMEWRKDNNFDDEAVSYWTDGWIAKENVGDWTPLTDWNHTMQVVEKMQEGKEYHNLYWNKTENGYRCFVILHGVGIFQRDRDINVTDSSAQRAICIAAILASQAIQ